MLHPLPLVLLLLPAAIAQAEPTVRYQEQIKPLLERHCVDCHSGWFPKGGLRLDSLEHILEGGKSGRAVLPGAPEKGWLINSVVPRGGRPTSMPPGPAHLSPAEIALLRQWIDQGAR